MEEGGRIVAHITDSPKPPPASVTLTLPAVNAANCCVFAACGAGKADMMARLLEENGRVDQAQYVLMTIIDDNPEYLPAYVELADIQIGQKRHDQAVATLRSAHAVSPADPVIANNLGVLLKARAQQIEDSGGNLAAAAALYDECAELLAFSEGAGHEWTKGAHADAARVQAALEIR